MSTKRRRQVNEYQAGVNLAFPIANRKLVVMLRGEKQDYSFTFTEAQVQQIEYALAKYREQYPEGRPLIEVLT